MGVDSCLLRLLLVLAVLSFSFFSMAQDSFARLAHHREVVDDTAPEDFEALISRVSDYYGVHFLYSSDFLPLVKRKVEGLNQYSLQQTLRLIFSGTEVEYFISGKNVLLRKRSETGSPEKLPPKPAVAPRETLLRPSPVKFSVQPIVYQPAPLQPANLAGFSMELPSVDAPEIITEGPPSIHPVKLGPAYVQPRKQYQFLDKMGEPVKAMKPNMKLVMTDYSNSRLRETDETLYKYRLVNFSLVPGLGSNGLNPGTYYNGVSLNLSVDYSAGNNLVGISGISNFSKYSAYGLQLAGLVNVVGGDLRQHRNYSRSELIEMRSPFRGIQLAGVGNVVTGDVRGFEAGLIFNLIGGSVRGWQFSAASNMVAERVIGAQTSLLFNYAGYSVNGFQLGAVNYTDSDLHGVQMGLVNRSTNMSNPAYSTLNGDGMQLGLFNRSGAMGGYQLGLANLAGNMNGLQIGGFNSSRSARGTHIGLVNLFSDHKGYAFGLLNFGGSYAVRFWASETFPSQIGIVTGTEKIANTIFYSRSFLLAGPQGPWPTQAFGYGVSKGRLFDLRDQLFLEYLDYRFNVSWVNFSNTDKQPFNLLFNPHLVYGRKVLDNMYMTFGGGLNAWWMPGVEELRLSRLELASFSGQNSSWKLWPGITLGFEMLE